MSIQLFKADLVVKGDFCAGGEIFDQFERSSPACLGLDFFTGRLRPNNQNRSGNLSASGGSSIQSRASNVLVV